MRENAMVAIQSGLQQVIDTLRRQRVVQGDLSRVLDCVVIQATVVAEMSSSGPLVETARKMKSRALELHRIHNSVPKFVVEDLLEESIANLEKVRKKELDGL